MSPNTTTLRPAKESDATRICDVLIRSVREICGPDYGNDEAILDSWCANKTPQNVAEWIQNPENFFVVAELRPLGIVGAGLLKRSKASIDLCYVAPEGLHRGVGSKLIASMEAEASRLERMHVLLNSTITAREFYERHGYEPNGEAMYWGKILCYPMRKALSR